MSALFARLSLLCSLVLVAACGSAPPPDAPDVSRNEVAALTQAILALGPGVDPDEAARAAEISIEYPKQLRIDYQVTDPPLVHNTKVNMGLRPRGLCYQWADDTEARLAQENFRTLALHRAIANSDNIRIEHSTVIVSRRGDGMFDGIVVDGWRKGGTTYWAPTLKDEKYEWVARAEVFERKRRLAANQ